MTIGKIETYPEAARVIHVWLEEFCDEKRSYPDMIAEAGRRAAKEIERLRDLTTKSDRDHLRIGITVKREFSNSENDISRAAWKLHLKQKRILPKIKDEELSKLIGLKGHTAKLVEGGD